MNGDQLRKVAQTVPATATHVAVWMGRVYFNMPHDWSPVDFRITEALSQQQTRGRARRWQVEINKL
jgi:hypothetical protein